MELSQLRKEIDSVDEELAKLFARRMELTAKVAECKKESGAATLDLAREEAVLANAESICGHYGRELYKTILDISKRQQTALRSK